MPIVTTTVSLLLVIGVCRYHSYPWGSPADSHERLLQNRFLVKLKVVVYKLVTMYIHTIHMRTHAHAHRVMTL